MTSLQRQKEKQREKMERVNQEWKIHPGFLRTSKPQKLNNMTDMKNIFCACSDSGRPALKLQITMLHTAEQGFLVSAIPAAIRNCFPIC